MRRVLYIIRLRKEEQEGLGVFRKVDIALELGVNPTWNYYTVVIESYSVYRCLYYRHSIKGCPAQGQHGHIIKERTVLVGYACSGHLSKQ